MTNIVFHTVALEYFQSYQKQTTMRLDQPPGLYFLTGRNEVDPHLGANGAGKSALFAALLWCLYGRLPGGERGNVATNSHERKPHVIVTLSINDAVHVIKRWAAPERVVLDDQAVEQTTIDDLLGLTRQQFQQTAFFGQDTPTFYDLSVPERGALLEGVLDLEIWRQAADAAAAEETDLLHAIERETVAMATLEGKSAALATEAVALDQQQAAWRESQQARIDTAIAAVAAAEQRIADAQAELVKLDREQGELPADPGETTAPVRAELETLLREHAEILLVQRDAASLLAFYQLHEACPTCHQLIADAFRQAELKKQQGRTKQALARYSQLEELIPRRRQAITEIERHAARRRDLMASIEICRVKARQAIDQEEHTIAGLTRQIELLAEDDPYALRLAQVAEQRGRIAQQQAIREDELTILKGDAQLCAFWKKGFGRVKLYVINRVTAALSLEATQAVGQLGLAGWSIAITTETENKSGTSKFGVQIVVTAPDGQTRLWSGGEAQRIRLAVSCGVSQTILRIINQRGRFQVFDEPTQFLSQDGVEDLVKMLRERALALGLTCWLVDHRSLDRGGFAESWLAVKDSAGSRLERVA